jgi:hypothetical protein
MLDDDDPILKHHIRWINEKVKQFSNKLSDNRAVIVINKNQYILYLDHMKLVSIESNKALKGSCFLFYPVGNSMDIKFHPYSIIETIESNMKYKGMYNIGCEVVTDAPTWIYFRHQLSTSAYQKEFIIDEQVMLIDGKEKISKHLEFYGGGRLDHLVESLRKERRSSEIIVWRSTRDAERKRIVILVDDLKLYENALRFCVFIKHNFIINIVSLDTNTSTDFIKQNSEFFEKSIQIPKDNHALTVARLKPDYIFIFAKPEVEMPFKRHKHCFINSGHKTHRIMDMEIKNVLSWKRLEFMLLYNKLLNGLNS